MAVGTALTVAVAGATGIVTGVNTTFRTILGVGVNISAGDVVKNAYLYINGLIRYRSIFFFVL